MELIAGNRLGPRRVGMPGYEALYGHALLAATRNLGVQSDLYISNFWLTGECV